jgi:CheY-like chemotaxis protein
VSEESVSETKLETLWPVSVIAAANAVMAWELLESPSNQFDLVLLDVVMPSLSGVGFLLKIMKHDSFKQIPVVSKLLTP